MNYLERNGLDKTFISPDLPITVKGDSFRLPPFMVFVMPKGSGSEIAETGLLAYAKSS